MATLTMYDEFQKPVRPATEWYEAKYLTIQFGTDLEPEHYTEIYVDADGYNIDADNLTDEQYWVVDTYCKEAQQAIREGDADDRAYSSYLDQLSSARY